MHLFTKATLEAAQPLIDMISEHDMCMALPKDTPTLEACTTKNFTRVDNVFCTANMLDCVISCNTYPHWRPQKTDHVRGYNLRHSSPENSRTQTPNILRRGETPYIPPYRRRPQSPTPSPSPSLPSFTSVSDSDL